MAAPAPQKKSGVMERVLDVIERVGNKVPHPAILFLALCVGIILLSQVLYWAGASATYEVVKPPAAPAEQVDIAGSTLPAEVMPGEQANAGEYKVVTETVKARGLLTTEGIRYLFTSFVRNFMGFTAMGIILIVMIGVGVAELSGLIASLIRKLVAVSSVGALTYIIVFLGVISSIASDAGYLVLIPLGAAAFKSVGRHPLAGMAAAFAGVAGGFGVNLLVTPTDAILTEITNEAIHLVDPAQSVAITANLYFGIASTILLTIVLALVTARIVEPRLGSYDPAVAPSSEEHSDEPDAFANITPGAGLPGPSLGGLRTADHHRAHRASDPTSGLSSARAGHGTDHRHVPVHGQPHRHHRAGLPGSGPRLRARRGDPEEQHGRDQRDHQVVVRARGPALPVPAHRAVHRLLQLLEHGSDRGREARGHD